MNDKRPEENNSSKGSRDESKMITLMINMKQHLVFLEKKIDMIIKTLPSKPAAGGYRSRRERPGQGHSRKYGAKSDHPAKEGNFERGSSFKPWRRKQKGSFKHKNKQPPRYIKPVTS